jgi:hypothetical protein
MNDAYPVRYDVEYPDRKLNRLTTFFRLFTIIPIAIVLGSVSGGAYVAVVIAWFAILFTGRYPRPLFDFVVGVYRWAIRVVAYAFVLTTDRYPPFRLSP